MGHGRNCGKKNMAIAIVKEALDIVSLLTSRNPIEVILEAITNGGPREDVTRIGNNQYNM